MFGKWFITCSHKVCTIAPIVFYTHYCSIVFIHYHKVSPTKWILYYCTQISHMKPLKHYHQFKKIPKLISISINSNSSPFYSRKNPLFKSSVAAFTILKRIIIFGAIFKLQVFSFKSFFKHESSENLIKNLIEKIMGKL